MSIDWLKLIPALLLLLTPIGIFHTRRVRFRALMRDWQGYWLRTIALGLHTIDLGRAMLGAWLLVDAVRTAPGAEPVMRYVVLIVVTVAMVAATALQTLICREPEAANAPFTFVAGLVIGTLPPTVSAFALILTVALAVGANLPAAFFPLLTVASSGLGLLFEGKKVLLDLIPTGLAVGFPWLITLMFPRHFVCTYRASAKPVVTSPLK